MNLRTMLALAGVLLTAATAGADGSIEDEVRATVEAYYAYTTEHLANPTDAISRDGSLQFWSSGGLMLTIEADTPPVEYESFGIRPKHIEVLPLAEGSAAALY